MTARMALPDRIQPPRAGKGMGGFTLVELLIVVAIIGIISAIAVPAYQRYQIRTQATAALADATALRTPVEAHVLGIAPFAPAGADGDSLEVDLEATPITITAKRPLGQLTLERDDLGGWVCQHDFATSLPGCLALGQYHTVSGADGLTYGGHGGLNGSYSGPGKVTIPATFGEDDLTEIGQDTFANAGLEEVVFASDSQVTQIHARAFQNNNIQQVSLPDSLKRLDWGAFSNNPNLNQVTIGSGVALEGNVFNEMSSFESAYGEGGAGTYILESGEWTKQ